MKFLKFFLVLFDALYNTITLNSQYILFSLKISEQEGLEKPLHLNLLQSFLRKLLFYW